MGPTLRSIIVHLQISAEEYQRLYEGIVKDVVALSMDGRRVRFPANILRPFVTHLGISGKFTIYFGDDNRYQHIEKIQ